MFTLASASSSSRCKSLSSSRCSVLVLLLLELVVKTQLTTYDNSHGFISNNHDRYLAKEISSMQDELADIRGSSINSKLISNLQIKFNPEILDFKQRQLGVPHLEKVTLINNDSKFSVDMTSISGSTVHFHSSFFENKKIPPLGNTTFNVVFLGREEGSIESNLFIHTTQGYYKYRVKGDSIFSPYRLRPIVGVKVPLNVTFSPFIYVYNPFNEAIQVVEIYCSGGEFHLELPSGEVEGPKDMWEIAPHVTKAIIRVRFFSSTEQNYTSYIRIKLNRSDEVLVVPLEIQVTSASVLFEPQGYVDFGVGGSTNAPKSVNLTLCNASKKNMKIASVYTDSKAVSVEYVDTHQHVAMASGPDQPNCLAIARLTLNWTKAFETADFYGKLIVKYKSTKTISEIPYYATVIEGGLHVNASQTTFFMDGKHFKSAKRSIVVRNDFPAPITLINVTLSHKARPYFQITDFSPMVLACGHALPIFTLMANTDVAWKHVKLNTSIYIQTNISTETIPLVGYDGKFDVRFSHKSKENALDLGMISFDSRKQSHIMLINNNPVAIALKQVITSIPSGYVNVLGCGWTDSSEALLNEEFHNLMWCAEVRSGQYAIMKLSVRSGRAEAQIWGDISIYTQFEQISIPVHFKIAPGKLEIGPDRLVFDQCFPGKICSHPLKIHSTFDHPMVIEDILSVPPDSRITCKHSGQIMSRTTKVVGTLYLNPRQRCQHECYLGISDANTEALWWQSLALHASSIEFDLNLVNLLYYRYLNETAHGLIHWQNLTLRLDTSEVKGHYFKTRVKMSWPSLLVGQTFENRSAITFPLTQVGNVTFENITISNPSSFELLVQIVLDTFYPQFDSLYEGLAPAFVARYERTNPHGFFLDTSGDKRQFETAHPKSIPVRLKPKDHFTVRVGFRAIDSTPNVGYLVLRNNLTILEVVPLMAKGAVPQFKFGNRKPGSTQPLLFEFGEKHLRECDIMARGSNVKRTGAVITLKRSFTAKNNGDIPIYVNNFYINHAPCEGYGFKVLNCEPTILYPNVSKKIDIAFSPDFTLAKITRTLVLDTSLNYGVNYTLVSSIPSFYLQTCSEALQRPLWESSLYNLAVSLMLIVVLFVIIASMVESERICKEAVLLIARQNNVQHTLDLRSIGAQTRQELQSKPELVALESHSKKVQNVLKADANKALAENCEKYSTLAPTAAAASTINKCKRKNRKLCDLQERENHKKLWMEAQKLKHDDHKQNESECLKKIAKKSQPKKLEATKSVDVHISEEETSSTTTESSNQEEPDKKIKKTKLQQDNLSNGADKENLLATSEKCRNPPKSKSKHLIDSKVSNEIEKVVTTIEKVKPNRRERKDTIKTGSMRKIPAEKNKTSDHMTYRKSPTSFMHHISTPMVSSNIWNENKASFSDVVARSEIPNTAVFTTLAKTTSATSKPTMYVEPYKQAQISQPMPTDSPKLGPIGSRGLWDNPDVGNNLSDMNRYFADAVESTNAFLDINPWQNVDKSPQFIQQIQQSNNMNTPRNPWVANSSSSWCENNSYSQVNNSMENSRNFANDATYSTNYLWGSSVWQPLPSPLPRTPTRTPPGFAPHQSDEEKNRLLQQQSQNQRQNINYSPFGPNIWASPHNDNPWYSNGQ